MFKSRGDCVIMYLEKALCDDFLRLSDSNMQSVFFISDTNQFERNVKTLKLRRKSGAAPRVRPLPASLEDENATDKINL